MGELVFELFLQLSTFFSGLFPERFRLAARSGPAWRRVLINLVVGLGSVIVGLAVAAVVLAVIAFVVVSGIAILRLN